MRRDCDFDFVRYVDAGNNSMRRSRAAGDAVHAYFGESLRLCSESLWNGNLRMRAYRCGHVLAGSVRARCVCSILRLGPSLATVHQPAENAVTPDSTATGLRTINSNGISINDRQESGGGLHRTHEVDGWIPFKSTVAIEFSRRRQICNSSGRVRCQRW